ncbi:MAG: type II toxin-antitoxin system PemK/MazF family toxin [Ardenticatenaceae bacterium]|nr:type II toxin-antitoxin system PemK/MazF family toxin [Ardenticatenaceae bacterium]
MTTTMPPKPTYKRGDVVLVLFPHSDLRTAKTRPALLVQADNLQTGLSQVVVAMISSKVFRANHPSRVLVRLSSDDGKQSGLLTDSVVMTDNLATILETAIDRKIGTLSMKEVDKALQHTLGLEDEETKSE